MLEEELPTKDPRKLFDVWFQDANSLLNKQMSFEEVNTFCLSTVDRLAEVIGRTRVFVPFLRRGWPHSRMVLLKEYNTDGLVFFTNYTSAKGNEIEACDRVAALFYWPCMHRQVRRNKEKRRNKVGFFFRFALKDTPPRSATLNRTLIGTVDQLKAVFQQRPVHSRTLSKTGLL